MKRVAVALSCLALGWTVASSPLLAQAAQKIGVFDAQRISEETAEGKRIQGHLSEFREKKQNELQAKEKEFGDLQGQLTNQALSLSAERKASLEKDLQRRALELNQAKESAGREMQLEVNEAQSRFQTQLLGVVEQFGRDEGFSVIVEKSLVAYSDTSSDITTALVDRFNKLVPAAAPEGAAAKPKPASPPPAPKAP